MHFSTTFVAAALAATVSAHMNMADPPPLKYKGNPNAKTIDSDITSPNTAATFPCKGALDVFDTAEGASVATWAPGSQQTIKIEGGASHNGGSCQVSLSYDSGSNWTAIYSKEGDCPTTPSLSFTVPSDTPTGDKVLLAWSWINHTGNREFYMNCASITIGGSSSKREETEKPAKRDTAFADRPAMLVANLPGVSDMCVAEGFDAAYPSPGPDVDVVGSTTAVASVCGGASATAPAITTSAAATTTAAATTSAAATASAAAGSSASLYVSSSISPSFITSTTKAPFTNSSAPSTVLTANPTELTVVPISSQSISITSKTNQTSALMPSSSSSGGVFITTPAGGSSSAAQQTTLSTKTTAAGGASSSAAATKSSSAAPSTGTGGSVSGAQTGSCTDEGAWSCVNGNSFQRCASGAWSAVMPMAAGTTCTVGVSDSLSIQRRNVRHVRRNPGAWGHI
ncbi:putative Chitin-binding type-4 domain-containing protein [Seiridium unicorne]|uniref:Chitin-binding type-4 domain-containing protein n=1 Tax=Seiridium unicorne TaxID=138068 RepID=A0ABR2V9T9_9PEZI